jgi:DEAD/DEAH box helicase domain-containing protein
VPSRCLRTGSRQSLSHQVQNTRSCAAERPDRVCAGSTNQYQIKTGIALGHQVRTDVLEIQLRDLNGQWVSHRGIALTIAVALRDALAALLGVQTGELGCDVQETRAADNQRCQSVFVFDRYAAGYASSAERLINDMFREAAKRLDCPKACDSSCPHCILDFDQRFEAGVLDRFAALAVISTDWLDMLKIPESLRYFGDSSRSRSREWWRRCCGKAAIPMRCKRACSRVARRTVSILRLPRSGWSPTVSRHFPVRSKS